MINGNEISSKVKKYRRLKHLTQAQLAEMADISTIHLSHIETGAVSMSLDSLLKICDALELTPNHLLLPDSRLKEDSTLLREELESLTEDEMLLLVRMMALLKELKINR